PSHRARHEVPAAACPARDRAELRPQDSRRRARSDHPRPGGGRGLSRRGGRRGGQAGGGAMLTLKHVSAGYGPITVIPDLSLHVGEGETVALLGPNGAGKSTLTAAIAGVLRRRAGSIEFDGTELIGLPPHRVVAAGVV